MTETQKTWSQVGAEMAAPFPIEAISWKPQVLTKAKDKAMVATYGDMREYQRRLDQHLGVSGWQVAYKPWGDNKVICELTITVNDLAVMKSATGEYSDGGGRDAPEGTAAEAQAFKRACAMFGLGRYLYELPTSWVAFDDQKKAITPEGVAELKKRYMDWYARVTKGTATATAAASKPAPAAPTPTVATPAKAPEAPDAAPAETVATPAASGDTPAFHSPVEAKAWAKSAGKDADALWLEAVKRNGGFNPGKAEAVYASFSELVNG